MNGSCRDLLGTEWEGSWAIEEGKVCGKWWVCIVLCVRHLHIYVCCVPDFCVVVFQYLLSSIDRDFIVSDDSIVSPFLLSFCLSFMARQPLVGQGPPPCRGFTITLRHTTIGRTSLNEWLAPRRDLYLMTHNIQKRDIYAADGIRTHNSSKRAAADLRLAFLYCIWSEYIVIVLHFMYH